MLILSHHFLLQAVMTVGPEVLIVIAAALLIPARRGFEAIGDAQAVINYRLILPPLLASSSLAAVIPFLLLVVPLSDPKARRQLKAFVAMLLLGIVLLLIVIVGVLVIAAQAGVGLNILVAPFWRTFQPQQMPLVEPPILMIMIGLAERTDLDAVAGTGTNTSGLGGQLMASPALGPARLAGGVDVLPAV